MATTAALLPAIAGSCRLPWVTLSMDEQTPSCHRASRSVSTDGRRMACDRNAVSVSCQSRAGVSKARRGVIQRSTVLGVNHCTANASAKHATLLD